MSLARWVGQMAMGPFSKALPRMGDTERAALEAGTVGFEGQLLSGRPDFDALIASGPNVLSAAEQQFLDTEVRTLCAMLDDFAIDSAGDMPPEVWQYMREQRFFGMIIPTEWGGLGFGHFAHAAVVTRLATVSVTAAVTVMVPNSLGPAELLLSYGTEAQKKHYLPRLAEGRDLPCFGLTSPYAGSDAASIPDRGILTTREIDGQTVRGFSVTFSKRYITLAPVATVVGLAFNARDESLPEGARDLGITCALIPVPTPGMQIGRRHRPMDSAFMNGPIEGEDVFVPMDWIIGGEKQVGQGWRMLMESLAAGRAISLPALGAATQQTSVFVANGYGKVRDQFGLPIGKFDAVAGIIAGMAVELYATDAARRFTAGALDHGEQPSVASAILKVHLTEAGRRSVNHAMDILGGKGISNGPSNLLSVAYRHMPVAITVEGANILTRSLIIFGQGAVRCHPFVMAEMQAVEKQDAQALGQALLGGKLKRMELLSARLGDCLSHLYMASACLWRYAVEDDERMLPLARAALRTQLDAAEEVLKDLYANLPAPGRRLIGQLVLSRTAHLAPLRDVQMLALAALLRDQPEVVSRLCQDVSVPKSGGLLDLMQALTLTEQLGSGPTAELNKLVRRTRSFEDAAADMPDPALALAYLYAADKVIQVDDFPGLQGNAYASGD